MALRINTNVAALNSHKQLVKTDSNMSSALEKLSSGLRINKAADDASGMAIADSLRSQALGLGQAIRNGNDGVSIVQTADAALEESINIVNLIKQKSIQSAQDGQTTESRKAIQADISKLREELNNIAKTTSFNNQKLLSGNFTDKQFQIGSYAGETVNISIQSTESTKIGHITTSNLTFDNAGLSQLNVYSNLLDETFTLNSIDLQYNNSMENGVGAVADAINKLSDVLGISATPSVEVSTAQHIVAGSTDTSFAINGVVIGALNVKENDADGALVAAINNKTSQHGITASVDEKGILTLRSTDHRAIEVTMDEGTQSVMGNTKTMTTLGRVIVHQEGTSEIRITDINSNNGVAVSTVGGSITVSGATATTKDSIAADGSRLFSSTLGSGTIVAGSFTVSGTASATENDIIAQGSIYGSGSVLGSGTIVQGSFTVSATAATSKDDSILKSGSILVSGSTIGQDTIFQGDVSQSLSGGTATVYVSGTGLNAVTIVSGGTTAVKAGTDLTLTADATLGSGSLLARKSVITTGSKVFTNLSTTEDTTVTSDMTLMSGSSLANGTTLLTGSTINNLVRGDGVVSGTMHLGKNTTLGNNSILNDGSTFGGSLYLKDNITVDTDSDMVVTAGSTLNSGSVITKGTYLTNNIKDENGTIFRAGTTLEHDIVVGGNGASNLPKDMVLNAGSVLSAGTRLQANELSTAGFATSSVSDGVSYRLSDVDVTTQAGAQLGIAIADAALKSLDKVRYVDFAEASANFTKLQILSQAGTFAMSQANASSQQVLSLLQ